MRNRNYLWASIIPLGFALVLLSAQLSYYRALSDLEQGLADLERAVGREITPAMMTAVNTGEVK
jgi:hypothetical protein